MEKKGQLMSQPFFYIFAIIVIGLVVVFGYQMIGKLLTTECNVENNQFLNDLSSNIDLFYRQSPGSSETCAIVNSYGISEDKCEIKMPRGVKGICFIDLGNVNTAIIPFKDLKEEIDIKKGNSDENLFFAADNENCKPDSRTIKKLNIKESFCIDAGKRINQIVIENIGKKVEIRKYVK